MIKIGVLGMSEGNAHPTSWSAIINGRFDTEEIVRLGYPAVAQYLQINKDLTGIPGAEVTHIWTQQESLSSQIAKTAGIGNIVTDIKDMIGKVDAVIIARDDPENHLQMAMPFIDAGVPLFIDKPLCDNREDLYFFSEAYRQHKFIMSCSSMRYATECRALKIALPSLGPLQLITAVGKKDWIKYGIHMLEAVFFLLEDVKPISVTNAGKSGREIVAVEFENGVQACIHLFQDISPTFQVSVFGSTGWQQADMRNFFAMFRDNIIDFIRSVQEGKPRLPLNKTIQIMNVLIAAGESAAQNGKFINLSL